MVENIVELLFGFFWGALILLVGSSIVGSIVAALRGVSHESDCGRENAKQVSDVVADVTVSEGRHRDIAYGRQTFRANRTTVKESTRTGDRYATLYWKDTMPRT
jgi:hypothetical protein